MKKNILILVFCMLSISLTAQERIAVLPFTGEESSKSNTLVRLLEIELAKLGNFQIIPRTAAINKIAEEQNFQRSGLISEDIIIELSNEANADYAVLGHVLSFGSKKMILTSIFHVETFQLVAGDYYEYNDLNEVRAYISTLAGKLVNKIKKDYSGIPVLAILPFDGVDEDNVDVLTQLLSIELANSEKYAVVSRTTTIENVLEEQNIQRSEIDIDTITKLGVTTNTDSVLSGSVINLDSDTITKLGAATNANYILSGSVISIDNDNLMIAEIIDVLTFGIKNSDAIKYKTAENGMGQMFGLSYKLTSAKSEKPKLEEPIEEEPIEEEPIEEEPIEEEPKEEEPIEEEPKEEEPKEEEKPKEKGKFAASQVPKNGLGLAGALLYVPKMITLENNFAGAINLFGSWGFLPFMFAGVDIGLYFLDDNIVSTAMATVGFNITLFKRFRPYVLGGMGIFFSPDQLYNLESNVRFMARVAPGIDFLIGNLDNVGFVINFEYAFDFFYNIGFVDRYSIGVGVHFGK